MKLSKGVIICKGYFLCTSMKSLSPIIQITQELSGVLGNTFSSEVSLNARSADPLWIDFLKVILSKVLYDD